MTESDSPMLLQGDGHDRDGGGCANQRADLLQAAHGKGLVVHDNRT
jgi:hypothetical protein